MNKNLKISVNRFPHLPKHAGVYLILDKESGLKYIGSSKNVNQRAHTYTAKSQPNKRGLFRNIKPENMVFSLLDDCRYLTLDERLKLECERIIEFNTLKPFGLNTQLPDVKLKSVYKKEKLKYVGVKQKRQGNPKFKIQAYKNIIKD